MYSHYFKPKQKTISLYSENTMTTRTHLHSLTHTHSYRKRPIVNNTQTDGIFSNFLCIGFYITFPLIKQ